MLLSFLLSIVYTTFAQGYDELIEEIISLSLSRTKEVSFSWDNLFIDENNTISLLVPIPVQKY
jgi:hypothetical protein